MKIHITNVSGDKIKLPGLTLIDADEPYYEVDIPNLEDLAKLIDDLGDCIVSASEGELYLQIYDGYAE